MPDYLALGGKHHGKFLPLNEAPANSDPILFRGEAMPYEPKTVRLFGPSYSFKATVLVCKDGKTGLSEVLAAKVMRRIAEKSAQQMEGL